MTLEIWRKRDVRLGPRDLIGAALLCPPFFDLEDAWRLTIDQDGFMTQDIFPLESADSVTRTVQLTPAQFDRILRLATEIGFAELRDRYDQDWTDDDTTAIVVRIGESEKRVDAYGAFTAAGEEQADMQKYVRFWEAIVEAAPSRSAAWKAERQQRTVKAQMEALQLRAKEGDVVLPTARTFLASICIIPLFALFLLVFRPGGFGPRTPKWPTLVEFVVLTSICYTVAMAIFIWGIYCRRNARQQAELELTRLQDSIEHT